MSNQTRTESPGLLHNSHLGIGVFFLQKVWLCYVIYRTGFALLRNKLKRIPIFYLC